MSRTRRRELSAACDRLLLMEAEVNAMDDEASRNWFMSKPGHADCFVVARALKVRLDATGASTVTHAENCNVKRLRDQDVECNCGAATGAEKEG